ncbi:MAG: SGNH/GDSL hydrolase family protein [Gammaproteobacteria bacterium]|nr:SGNH/GDSL hydrolase family protein [Gammaproteobacteria bacterium]
MTIKTKNFRFSWLAVLLLAIPAIAAAENEGVRYYVSVGTSLSVGIQPDAEGDNQRTNDGYPDQLFDIIEPQFRKIRLVKLGCPGETTVTMMAGGICTYPKGAQLAEAVNFLHAHKDKVELITIDMGINDVISADCIDGTEVNLNCIFDALAQISNNMPVILAALREAADPETPIIGMNYYNTFLAAWLTGPDGMDLAMQSAGLASILNDLVLGSADTGLGVYGAFGIPVADVAGAYQSNEFATLVPFPTPDSPFMIPLNVAIICQLTYMCVPPPVGPNIHANPTGYGVIAATFAAKFDDG